MGLTLLLGVVAGCVGDPSLTPPSPTPRPSVVAQEFMGNAACAECHSDIARSHAESHHAQTLNALTAQKTGKQTPPTGKIPGTEFVLSAGKGGYSVAAPVRSDTSVPLELALGSGKTGLTYVTFLEEGKIAEFRMSYFPLKKSWYVTPGQERMELESLGRVHPAENARRCMLCHSVTVPETGAKPESRFFGVGCESCHGAGGAHVRAAREGDYTTGRMQALEKLTATQLNLLCGKCHGTKEDVKTAHLPADVTNRMQTYGLMESQCFLKSKDTLSCLTCHNPHENVRTDSSFYERACLKCHSPHTPEQKACPVNPKEGCIRCHMPERKALAGSDIPMTMADHKIQKPLNF